MKLVSWFSAGITSTIATKLAIDKFGKDAVDIIFFETGSHHPDNERFIAQCEEQLFGKKVEIHQHHKHKTVDDVIKLGFINSPYGAYCTKLLKKDIRIKLEKGRDWDHQIFGFEAEKKEMNRALRFKEQYPNTNPIFPLIDVGLNKEQCAAMLNELGIDLPAMYQLGYTNNNCVGCVKGGMGYWNKIRKDFPEVFELMAKREREIGATCMRQLVKGKKEPLFLDDLVPGRGRDEPPITGECGVICATEFNDLDHPRLEDLVSGKFKISDFKWEKL